MQYRAGANIEGYRIARIELKRTCQKKKNLINKERLTNKKTIKPVKECIYFIK